MSAESKPEKGKPFIYIEPDPIIEENIALRAKNNSNKATCEQLRWLIDHKEGELQKQKIVLDERGKTIDRLIKEHVYMRQQVVVAIQGLEQLRNHPMPISDDENAVCAWIEGVIDATLYRINALEKDRHELLSA